MIACRIVSLDETNSLGFSGYTCERCHRKAFYTPDSPSDWKGDPIYCPAWPYLWEPAEWLHLCFAAMLGGGVVDWLWLKFGPLKPLEYAGEGPGTELAQLVHSLRVGRFGFVCQMRAWRMNAWGVAGCQEHREEILGWLKQADGHVGIVDRAVCVFHAIRLGLHVRCSDRLGSLLDEALRRS